MPIWTESTQFITLQKNHTQTSCTQKRVGYISSFSACGYFLHFSAASNISPTSASHLSVRWRETPTAPNPAPPLSLISQEEIPWQTAVPDGIITLHFPSHLARDPALAEVAVPLLCLRININTNIWQCYITLYLLGDMFL